MSEGAMVTTADEVERMPDGDLDDPRHRLQLVRHLVAMANSGGGTVVVGARRDGTVVGVTPEAAAAFDASAVAALVDDVVAPDRIDLTASATPAPEGRVVVAIEVRGHREPPLVPARAGTHQQRPAQGADGPGAEVEVFAAHQVLVRRNGRTEIARRDDHRRWRTDALDRLRRELHERLALVVEAPVGSTVRVVTDDEVQDEPSYFLTRSTELFRVQPEQLLSSRDLVYLWLHRRTLDPGPDAVRLIVHSALRKRATLYLWLAVLPVSVPRVRELLFEAVSMRDRDKSDAARAVLLVCALYLDADAYEALAAELGASSYAHMREAVDELPGREQATARLELERLAGTGQEELVSAPDHELFAQVDGLLAGNRTPPRRVPSIGLELFVRALERRDGRPQA
ncbi:MAG: RNA-binding domain-containing protein [Actinomycetota bacterium]